MSEKSPRRRRAVFTFEDGSWRPILLLRASRTAGKPYRVQRRVEAIIDIAEDGTLASVELIDRMPPLDASGVPPLPVPEQEKKHG